jgi:hypothetical protein
MPGMMLLFVRIGRSRTETLVLYHFADGRRSIRRRPSRFILSEPRRRIVQQRTPSVTPISESEFEELSALRKGQAWGAPLFQPGHAKYEVTAVRLKELEMKERAAS